MLLSDIIFAFLLTALIEIGVAALFGLRKRDLLYIVLINLITNPILNYLLFLNQQFKWISMNIYLLIFLEIIVMIAEWLMLRYALKDKSLALKLAVTMNATSFIIGLLLFGY